MGIEVIPNVPNNVEPNMRKFLASLRNAVIGLQGGYNPLRQVSNLTVIPIAGGNKIRWSKSNGEGYTLCMSTTASIADAILLQVGNLGEYNHAVGSGGVTYYYWVITTATGKKSSDPVGPVSGVTLGLNVPTVLPPPPPPTDGYGDGDEDNPCFTGETEVQITPTKVRRMDLLPAFFDITNDFGTFRARLIKHDYCGPVYSMPVNGRVTPKHYMKYADDWIMASVKFRAGKLEHFEGTVYNMEIYTDREECKNYKLKNHEVAHNSRAK